MKKFFLIPLMLIFSLLVFQQDVKAQTFNNNPWGGPRWSSVQVSYTVNQWIIEHNLLPDTDGERVSTDYTYLGRGTWGVNITWGTGWGETVTDSEYLVIKNNGEIIP